MESRIMKKTRAKILTGVILLAAMLLICGIAWAKATKIYHVTGTSYITPSEEEPLKEWTDDYGIWHIRGKVSNWVHEGDLEGPGVGVINLNFDYATGNGDESGYSSSFVTWEGLSGTFEGTWNLIYTDWVGIGHAVYLGTGDFAGMKLIEDLNINFTVTPEPPYALNFEGIILDLHGE